MNRLVTSDRWTFCKEYSGFSFCWPPCWRFGRMYSRPNVSVCSTLTIAGARVSRKNAPPAFCWFRPSAVLRLYCVRTATVQFDPITWSTFARNA